MTCPSCGRELPAEADRCPRCDDTGELGEDPQKRRITAEMPAAQLQRAAAAHKAVMRSRARRGATAPEARHGRLDRLAHNLELEESAVGREAARALLWARATYRSFGVWDRRGLAGVAGAFLCSFLPWFHRPGLGLEPGLADFGIATAALSLASFLCAAMRARAAPGVVRWLWPQVGAMAAVSGLAVWRALAVDATPAGVLAVAAAAAWSYLAALVGYVKG